MPILITFDQEGAGAHDLHRLQSMFIRFGWQNLGGSTYRYPRLDTKDKVEDWLNHVVPALMMLRSYFTTTGRSLLRFTLDAHSSTAINNSSEIGSRPRNSADILCDSSKPEFGEAKLLSWLNDIIFPYRGTRRT